MNRSRWITAGAVLVVAVLLLLVMGEQSDLGRAAARTLGPRAPASERAQAQSHSDAPSHRRPSLRHRPGSATEDAADAASEDADEAPKVDVAKVEAALERFDTIASRITQEQLDTEQARMREANERLSAMEAPEPRARDIVDERGFRWVELTYPSGEVRYELPQ